MPADMRELADDVAAETAVLRDLVARLDRHGWQAPTPADGWTIADQISHLAYFDDAAIQSAADPEGFSAQLVRAFTEGELTPDDIARRYRSMPGEEVVEWFDASRRRLITVFSDLDPAMRLVVGCSGLRGTAGTRPPAACPRLSSLVIDRQAAAAA